MLKPQLNSNPFVHNCIISLIITTTFVTKVLHVKYVRVHSLENQIHHAVVFVASFVWTSAGFFLRYFSSVHAMAVAYVIMLRMCKVMT